MSDSVFDSLCIYTCTVQQAGDQTSYLGHTANDWSDTTDTTGVPCRLMPMSAGFAAELERRGFAGTVIAEHMLYIPWDDAPSTLKTAGAETTHRITTVADEDGTTLEDGPLDVQYASSTVGEAGEKHHVRLAVKRIA